MAAVAHAVAAVAGACGGGGATGFAKRYFEQFDGNYFRFEHKYRNARRVASRFVIINLPSEVKFSFLRQLGLAS